MNILQVIVIILILGILEVMRWENRKKLMDMEYEIKYLKRVVYGELDEMNEEIKKIKS